MTRGKLGTKAVKVQTTIYVEDERGRFPEAGAGSVFRYTATLVDLPARANAAIAGCSDHFPEEAVSNLRDALDDMGLGRLPEETRIEPEDGDKVEED